MDFKLRISPLSGFPHLPAAKAVINTPSALRGTLALDQGD
jgi:hypothetical protein